MMLALITVMIGFFAIIFLVLLVYWLNSRPTKYNGLLWLHPDKSVELIKGKKTGQIKPIKREPEGQNPFFMQYAWYHISKKPIWLWYEERVEKPGPGGAIEVTYEIKHYEPELPNIDISSDEPQPENQRRIIETPHPPGTPEALFDLIYWEPLKRYFTSKSPLTEAVKLGMGLVMVVILVVGTMFTLDMVMKNQSKNTSNVTVSQPLPSNQPIQQLK